MEKTESRRAIVNRIIPFSNVDGPGNRMAVFLQSCPFRCYYCHNPETIHMCNNCGECVSHCPKKALSIVDGKVVYDASICVGCDTCIHVCPNLSSPKTVSMSVDEVIGKIREVRPFIRGITISGGECMNQSDFLFELFSKLRKEDPTLSLLLDSNGFHDYRKKEELMMISDGVMLDVKAFDPEFHKFLCGVDNRSVLSNLSYLLSIHRLEEVRTVILPGYEKENENTVREVSRIIKDRCRYKLLRYRYFGVREEGVKLFGRGICPEEEMERMKKIALENHADKVVII